MSALIAEIKRRLPEATRGRQCKAGGCKLNMPSLSPKAMINVDAATREKELCISGKRCDYLILAASNRSHTLLPVEIKGQVGAGSDAKEILKQLQGGINAFEKLCRKEQWRDNIQHCYPVLVANRHQRVSRRKKDSVLFRGKSCYIQRRRCGGSIALDKCGRLRS